MDVEKHFGVDLPAAECRRVETVGQLANLIFAALQRAGASTYTPAAVLDEVRRLTAEQMGLPLETIQPHSSFAKDLGMG